MKRFIQYGAASVILASAIGCSFETENLHTVQQSRVHQTYDVTYTEASHQTDFTAHFRFGGSSGTNLRLGGKSMVQVNGQPMALHEFLGARYHASQPGLAAKTTFDFVDADGKAYQNRATLQAVAFDVASVPATHSKKNNLVFRWTGAPLEKGEWVEAQVAGEKHSTVSVEAKGNVAMIPACEFERLPAGSATVKLRRIQNANLTNANDVGGYLRTTYEAKPRPIKLTE